MSFCAPSSAIGKPRCLPMKNSESDDAKRSAIDWMCGSPPMIDSIASGSARSPSMRSPPTAGAEVADAAEVECEQRQRGQHRGERLRRGDRDLGTGVQVDAVALARDGRPDDVHERDHAAAAALDLLHGLERVGGLAGLAEGDVQRVALDHRVAIAELGGGLRVAGMRAVSSISWAPAMPA